MTDYFSWAVWAVVIEQLIRRLSKGYIKPSVWLGTIAYGLALVLQRLWLGVVHKYQVRKLKKQDAPEKVKIAKTPIEAVSTYNLKPLEVVVGLNSRNRPIRVDLLKYHTLVFGSTGFGKTTAVNNILMQLYAKGDIFDNEALVYLFDMKGDKEHDYLDLWAPVVHYYYSISDDKNGTQDAIRKLQHLADTVHSQPRGKHILVIIDEFANLTGNAPTSELGRAGRVTLSRLASTIRTRGKMLVATQYPKSTVIDTTISSNMARRLGFYVETDVQARLGFGYTPRKDILPQNPGEFLLKEPGRRGLIAGKGYNVKVPNDVDSCVFNYLQAKGKEDFRLCFLGGIIANLKPGAAMPGVKVLAKNSRGNGDSISQDRAMTMYRNYASAGILAPPKTRGQGYVLKVDYADAFARVKDYIRQGRWQSDPDTFVDV